MLKDLAKWCDDNPNGLLPFGVERFCSYRGDYSHLAIEADTAGNTPAGKLGRLLREQIGQTHQGYKGGSFTMDDWCDVHLVWTHSQGGPELTPLLLEALSFSGERRITPERLDELLNEY